MRSPCRAKSVRLDDGKTFVYQIVNNELQRRDIQTSISNLTQVEIASGVTEKALLALASTNSKPLHEGIDREGGSLRLISYT